MGFFDLFKPSKPKTMLDKVQELARPIVISRYRQWAAEYKCAPTSKTSDQQIMEIYQKVATAFKPLYTHNPIMSAIPWISGFILPVIPFTLVFEYHWLAIFFINLAVVFLLGPFLTKAFLVRFASGKGFGPDMMYSFVGGIITLIIGLIAR